MIYLVPDDTVITRWTKNRPLIWAIECEAERHWHNPNPPSILGPIVSPRHEREITAAMDELALLVSRRIDLVILRRKPDQAFIDYLKSYGLGQGTVYCIEAEDPRKDLSYLILNDKTVMRAISAKKNECGQTGFMFFGATSNGDDLVRRTGVDSVSASSGVTELVNDKCYSSSMDVPLNKVPSFVVHSSDDLVRCAKKMLGLAHKDGNGWILLKEPMGVSGRGIKIIKTEDELSLYTNYLKRRGLNDMNLVVEMYVDKRTDINYQFFVDDLGGIDYYSYKDAILSGQKHIGHYSTGKRDAWLDAMLSDASEKIGRDLSERGYYGVVGVDAIAAKSGQIFPLLEINARLNNSSFQWALDQVLASSYHLLTGQVILQISRKCEFERFRFEVLDKIKRDPNEDVIVMNWATIGRLTDFPATTRLMYAIISDSKHGCLKLQERFEHDVCSKIGCMQMRPNA